MNSTPSSQHPGAQARLAELREAHAAGVMVGWDFSRLDGRMTSEDSPWDFEDECLAALRSARRALDLGTGGGERLIRLLDALPETAATAHGGQIPEIHATEGWEPNVPVARANLASYGVDVHRYDAEAGDTLPFPDATLDLVMARHEAIDAREIARVLAPGGRFLTQQVHGLDAPELHEWFGGDVQYPHVTAEQYVADLEAAGLRIDEVEDWSGSMTIADARALVTYLAMVPWDVPEDFTVDAHAETLLDLDARAPIVVTQRRFRVTAARTERE